MDRSAASALTIIPSLHHAWTIGRGGAALVGAESELSSPTLTDLSGVTDTMTQELFLGKAVTPEGKAVTFMAIAMACHYLGYSLARPVTVALFTSETTGYAGFAAAFPLAMAFVSPFSILLLMLYGNLLDTFGPGGALLQSTTLCAVTVIAAAMGIAVFSRTKTLLFGIRAAKLISGPLFIFRESYVQLLTSQYWSFMASALTPSQSGRWFGPIAGLTSIASVVAGLAVPPLVDKIGLEGTLIGTGVMLLLSLIWAKKAYQVADQYGFTPVDHKKHGKSEKSSIFALIHKASHLFQRVPVLWALFMEILASQGLSTLLNVCFVARLGSAIPDDTKRAGWVGIFFALINVITMLLQFVLMPVVMKNVEPSDAWRVIPLFTLATVLFQAFQKDPSLFIVSASLLVMKVSEYSARRMLDEMVFVPLDFESRYVGKEVIGVFGYRFGKSLMSLALSGLTSVMGNFGLHQLSLLSAIVGCGWMKTAWTLSSYVPTRAEAEQAYQKEKNAEKVTKD